MKKLLFIATAVIAILGMAACSGKKAAETTETTDTTTTTTKTAYTGIVPGADCDGIWYTLQLNDGKYDLIETYIALDSTANLGINEILSVKSEGTYAMVNGEGDNAANSYLKLTPDVNDSAAQALYFLNATDSTITMVNAALEMPAAPDYYTLKVVK